ncbi:MAG TPA: 50S ribosomal protein L23 [Candidatus Dormibacteraeota bacterium]|nr:50S ribosomal protein L23 [Candidatus Dormibacteraeota bacterium]
MDARDVIIAPLITEKSMSNTMVQQYTFRVTSDATKTQIRHAVEEIFKVNVTKVNTVNVKGKIKSFSRRRARPTVGKQSDWKKAVVTLKEGQKIELGGVNYFEQ